MKYLKVIRFNEILILMGIPVIGVLYGIKIANNTAGVLQIRILLLLAADIFILSHIYTFNDWANFSYDKYNLCRKDDALQKKVLSLDELLIFSISLIVIGLVISFYLSIEMFFTGIFLFIFSFLYSHKKIFLKGITIISSLMHLIEGSLYFLFGYLLFNKFDLAGALFGIYFGIVYMAGHLNHEVKDSKWDSLSGIETNALKYGLKKMLYISFILIACSNIYLIILSAVGIIPWVMTFIALSIFPIYTYCFILTLKNDNINYENLIKFRNSYRKLYLFSGCVWCLILLDMNSKIM